MIYEQLENITAGIVCFATLTLTNNVDWLNEVVRVTSSFSVSILSGYVVHKLKQYYWDSNKKEKNDTNTNGN